MHLPIWSLVACSAFQSPAPEAPAPEPVVEAPPPQPPAPEPVDLVVPDSVDAMAARLTELELKIRDPETPLERLADLGHAEQRILRHLGSDPVAAKAVIAKLDGAVKANVQRLLDATTSMAHTVAKPRTDLPNWKIVDPLPAEELLSYYRASEEAHGVPWAILASINLNETRMGQLRGVSHVGAQGPMQFMPKTWAAYGTGDPTNDRDAIMAAGNYLAKMGWGKDQDRAIWHYNHSPAYVKGVKLCAEAMQEEPRMFHAMRGWKVYYRTVAGSIWLRTGYEETERISIAQYCDEVGEPYCPKH
ncbi:MAG: lytic transglycosylase domain-containing protein [Myxococcales bacterium]|nr:lytic transglycosylase domain-containing protein [Myxococcales bacterium]